MKSNTNRLMKIAENMLVMMPISKKSSQKKRAESFAILKELAESENIDATHT